MTELHIKNMVCQCCVRTVKTLLSQRGLTVGEVRLGVAQVQETMTLDLWSLVAEDLRSWGFELLTDPQSQIVEQVRSAVIEWVRMEGERDKLSQYLQHQLARDYSALSKLFSEVRGMTIERYAILQRIEFAKELLCYSELNVSEVSFRLGYSSPTHLSTQFRQETGLTPKAFQMQSGHRNGVARKSLNEL